LSDAAENLYIHPNTLKYRIQVIRKILGYDVLAWPARAELFLALALDRLRRRKNAVDAPLKEV
jgi:DNA-binding PucR family transcriptional regulator